MKTQKFLITIFSIALFILSCKKEKEIGQNNLQSRENIGQNALRIDPGDMENEMNEFINLVAEDSIIECGNYEARDALLIMEAALNYNTCLPDSGYDEVTTDTFTFEMPLRKDEFEGFILIPSDMESIWNEVFESVQEAKGRVNFSDPKEPFNVVVDLEFTKFDPESEESEQTAEVQVITLVGNNNQTQLSTCTYGSNDYWEAFVQPFSHGCGSNSGNTTSWCFQEMLRRLTANCGAKCADGGYLAYISSHYHDPYHNPINPPLLSCSSYYLYVQWSYPFTHCLDPSEMDCYTNGAKLAAEYFAPPVPYQQDGAKKCVISYQFQDWVPICNCPPAFWSCVNYYGIRFH